MVDFGLSIPLHDVVALRIEVMVGGGGTHISELFKRWIDPVASQFGGKNERQIGTYVQKLRLKHTPKKELDKPEDVLREHIVVTIKC